MTNKKHQIKSSNYYRFWGICTVAVVIGQLYIGTGYRYMAESVNSLTYTFREILNIANSN
jgi:hypothetical protein